ncbi:hypothetical protein HC761_00870 [bacterium]|nr:hypothetical protein [bacterium]
MAGVPRKTAPSCLMAHGGSAKASEASDIERPLIVSPLKHVRYALRANELGRTAIRLGAQSKSASLYWFLDQQFLGRSQADRDFEFRPKTTGRFTLRVVDDLGRSSERALVIERVL